MPYTPKQQKVLKAVAHGWKPKRAFKNVGRVKAEQMLNHSTKRSASAKAQADAIERVQPDTR